MDINGAGEKKGGNALVDTPKVNNLGLGAGTTHSDILIVVNSVLSETISDLSRQGMYSIQKILQFHFGSKYSDAFS